MARLNAFMQLLANPFGSAAPVPSEEDLWEEAVHGSTTSNRVWAARLLKQHHGYDLHDVRDHVKKRTRLVVCKPGAWRAAKRYMREHPDAEDLIFWAGEFGCTAVD